MNLLRISSEIPSRHKNLRLVPLLSLMAILGNSPTSIAETGPKQIFELSTPAQINSYLFWPQGMVPEAQKAVESLTKEDWNTINTIKEWGRKFQYLCNTFRSWARLQWLADENKMIMEVKKTAAGFIVLGQIIQHGDPKKPFWKPFVIAKVIAPN